MLFPGAVGRVVASTLMELHGAAYLYALAALSITFSGFSALLMVLRQTSGGTASAFDVFLTVNYLRSGLAIALACFLPPLLSGWGAIPEAVIWRVSSLVAAVLGIGIETFVVLRRSSATPDPMPGFTIFLLLSYWPGFVLMLLNARGSWIHSGFGPYAAALTWTFMVAGLDFTAALTQLHRTKPSTPGTGCPSVE